jgi:outer membrane protein
MKSARFTLVFVIVIMLVLMGINIFQWFYAKEKIVYVRSYELIEKYQGTVEARAEFEKRKTKMLSNVDSLRLDFERSRNAYIQVSRKLSSESREQQEAVLGQQQNQLVQYQQAIDQKIQEEDSKMMQEVLNQVNSLIEEHAIREGYDIILGTTMSGNVLFGDKSLDITDAVLLELNNRYKGK